MSGTRPRRGSGSPLPGRRRRRQALALAEGLSARRPSPPGEVKHGWRCSLPCSACDGTLKIGLPHALRLGWLPGYHVAHACVLRRAMCSLALLQRRGGGAPAAGQFPAADRYDTATAGRGRQRHPCRDATAGGTWQLAGGTHQQRQRLGRPPGEHPHAAAAHRAAGWRLHAACGSGSAVDGAI